MFSDGCQSYQSIPRWGLSPGGGGPWWGVSLGGGWLWVGPWVGGGPVWGVALGGGSPLGGGGVGFGIWKAVHYWFTSWCASRLDGRRAATVWR